MNSESIVEVTVVEETTGLVIPNTGGNNNFNQNLSSQSFAILAVAGAIIVTSIIAIFARRIKAKHLAIIGIFVMAAAVSFLLNVKFSPASEEISVKNATLVGAESISLNTIDTVSMGTLVKGTDSFGTNSHAVKVTTNSPSGYTVSIKTKTSEQAMVSDDVTDRIEPVDSTEVLADNTWGYSLTSTAESDAWTAVPTTATTIIDKSSAATAGESTDVNFGVKIGSDIAVGTYKNTVVYSVVGKLTTIPAPTIESVTPSSGSTEGGTTITIVGTNFTLNGESITTDVLIDGVACTDVVITADTPTTGKDTITCKTPSHNAGRVDATVKTWGGEATGDYTYVPSEIIYVTPDIASTKSGDDSGPAFTIVGTGFINESDPVVDVKIGDNSCDAYQIVNNTHIVCTKGPNSGLTTGAKKVIVYHQSGAISGGNINVTYSDTNYPEFGDSVKAACTATKTIARDTRDSQLYYVRLMEDGKCWMVDSLKYAGYGTLSQVVGEYLTTTGARPGDDTLNDVAKFVDPGAMKYCVQSDLGTTVTRCGFLYNWYAATKGSGNSSVTGDGINVTDSICPSGTKLPSSKSGMNANADGTSLGYADWPVLNVSMHEGTPSLGYEDTTTETWRSNWLPATSDFNANYASTWGSDFMLNTPRANTMYYWSSTSSPSKNGRARAHNFYLNQNTIHTASTSYDNERFYAHGVRCVEDQTTSM